MDLASYLRRIGYSGPVQPDLDCLRAVHRHHLNAIPYEDLDIQLGQPLDLDLQRIRRKLIIDQRGGWCYEMNGLLGWALAEIGFDVTRMTGGVMRSERGDSAYGNHLVLRVDLDGDSWIADAGLGDALTEPIPIREGDYQQNGRSYSLTRLDGDTWRFHNHSGRLPPDMDFINEPADEDLFVTTSSVLQSDADSVFVQNLMCFRCRMDGAVDMLLGRVYEHLSDDAPDKKLLACAAELEELLATVFGIQTADIDRLWDKVVERHELIFGDQM